MTGPKKLKLRAPSPSALEDVWQRRATAVAIEKARALVTGGALPPMTPIGRLSDHEWGWIVCNVLFGWIHTRAEQATNNGVGSDKYIRDTALEPDPLLTGAISSILPELARPEIDWSKSLAEFSRDEMIEFLVDAFVLINKAIAMRNKGEEQVTTKPPKGTAGPAADWDDGIPERYAKETNQ
jgi:hypothetical protein